MRPSPIFVALAVALVLGACSGSAKPRTLPAARADLECPAALSSPAIAIATPAPIAAPRCEVPARDYPFRNLVFQGGGVKGLAYIGALEILGELGILGRVERVAGTSAGAITAVLVALEYTPAEIRRVMLGLDFATFEDAGRPSRLLREYGWFAGHRALDFMRCVVRFKTGDPTSTFADLERRGSRELRVFATELVSGEAYEFSAAKTPDVAVADAVRISMSIPLYFASVEDGERLFVDGGLVRNYPIDTFDGPEGRDPQTLGLALGRPETRRDARPITHLREYARALAEATHRAEIDALHDNAAETLRTVFLDDLGVRAVDFEITAQKAAELAASGAQGACEFLRAWEAR